MATTTALPHSSKGSGSASLPASLSLALVVPLAILVLSNVGDVSDPWAVLMVATGTLGLTSATASRRIEPARLGFWTFWFVWFGLAGAAQLGSATYPWTDVTSPGDERLAAMMALAAGAAYEVGRRLPGGRSVGPSRLQTTRLRPMPALLYTIGAILIALVGIVAIDGVGSLFSSREQLSNVISSTTESSVGGGALRLGLTAPLFASALILVRSRAMSGRWPWAGTLPGAAPAVVAAAIVVNNPVSQPRYWTLAILGTLALAASRPSPRRAGLFALVAVVVIVATFPMLAWFRTAEASDRQFRLSIDSLVSAADYDAFQQSANAVRYVDDQGHTFGRQLLGGPLSFVPRSMWEDKPRNSGELVADHAGYDYVNLSSPAWAEAYLDFGWSGIVVSMVAFGVVSRRVDRYYERQFHHRWIGPGLCAFFAVYQVIVLRGSLLQASQRAIVLGAALLVALSFGTRRNA